MRSRLVGQAAGFQPAMALLLVAGVALGCTSSKAQTTADQPATGTTPSGAATSLLASARSAEQSGDTAAAHAQYQQLVREHPRAPEVPDALLGVGRTGAGAGQREAARQALQTLAMNHPTHPAADEAKRLMAEMDIEDGRTAEGVAALRAAMDKVPEKDRIPMARKMGVSLADSGQYTAALIPLATAEHGTQDPTEKVALQARILDIVDRQLTPRDLLALREQLGSCYARHLLTLKLARVYVHLGEDPRAVDEFKAFLAADPSSALAPGASATLKLLEDRSLVATHKLGIILPSTGKYAQTGERVLTAIKLGLESAAQEAAQKLGRPTQAVEVVVVDDKGETEEAARAVDGLVQEQRVIAVAGPITLQGASAAAVRAEALKVPLVTMARREGLAEMGPYTFAFTLTDERQAREVAKISVRNLGFKRVAILYPRLPRGVALTNAFWDEFEAQGGAIAGAESYDHDETTFTTPVRKLVGRHYQEARYEFIQCNAEARQVEQSYKRQKALEQCKDTLKPIVDFDAIFIADFHKPVGLIAPALAFEDVFVGNDERSLRQFKEATGALKVKKVLLLGTNVFNDKSLPTRGGKYVQGAIFVDGFNPNDSRMETLAFLKAFAAATNGSRPDLREAQAYDAGRALGFTFATNPGSRAAFRDALQNLKDVTGVTGTISFDQHGSAVTPLQVFTVKQTNIVPAVLDTPSGG